MNTSLHNVKIKDNQIYIDGIEIHGITSIDYYTSVDEAPHIALDVIPMACDIEQLMNVQWRFSYTDLKEISKIVKFAMCLDDDFRRGMIASGASVLVERGEDFGTAQLITEKMLKRIFDDE